MRAGDSLVFAQAAVGFGWILGCEQIVGDGDDGEKNQDQDGQGNQLLSAADTGARGKHGPYGEKRDRQQCPREIECQLHSQR